MFQKGMGQAGQLPKPKYKPGDRFVVEVEKALPPQGGEPMYRLSNGAAWMESRLDALPSVGNVSVHSKDPGEDPVAALGGDLSGESRDAVREAVSGLLSQPVSEDTAMRHALAWALENLDWEG